MNHLVANAGAWSICFFDEITNITASTKMMVNQSEYSVDGLMHRCSIYKLLQIDVLTCVRQDVNFWGSVYPTYYALPHLKASKGKLIVSSSIAATAPTSRLSLYNVSNETSPERSLILSVDQSSPNAF